MSEWKPRKMAPKDGTPILVWECDQWALHDCVLAKYDAINDEWFMVMPRDVSGVKIAVPWFDYWISLDALPSPPKGEGE